MSASGAPGPTGARGRRRLTSELDVEAAALAELEAVGFERLTMERIATAAGVSVRTAFRYFPTKVDSLLHTARGVAEAMEAALAAALEAGGGIAAAEDAIAGTLTELLAEEGDAVDRLRRIRRCMLADPRLRAEVARAEQRSTATSGAMPLERRVLLELVAATMSAAFDDWAAGEDATPSADGGARLLATYARARAARTALIA